MKTSEEQPPQHQVFINFRGEDVRNTFVTHLVRYLESNKINVYIDAHENRGENLDVLLTRIVESKIAVVIFSENYTDSIWCLKELDKIKECSDEGTLVVIPIFFKLEPSTVKNLEGEFGDRFRRLPKGSERKNWKKAIKSIPEKMGIVINSGSDEGEEANEIVKEVSKVLNNIPLERSQMASVDPSGDSKAATFSGVGKQKTFGNVQRLKELEEKLDRDKYKATRIIGVVGMPGIGKSTLMKELYKMWMCRFSRHALLDKIHAKSKESGSACLPTLLLREFSKLNDEHIKIDDHVDSFDQLRERKVLVILDGVSKREHIDSLRVILDKIKKGQKGSRVVIATSDRYLTNDLVDDTYVVQNLNHIDSFNLFCFHAFNGDQANPPKEFMKLSGEFVRYARGHPLALKVLGGELKNKKMDHWDSKLKKLAESPGPNIASVFQVSYDGLTLEHKDAFLDIACFRSQDKDYVESLLASSNPRHADAMNAVEALTNKFLINTCDDRVEMHDLLYTFSREVNLEGSTQDESRKRRLCLRKEIVKLGAINVLQNKVEAANIRGIFLDLSEVEGEISLDQNHFVGMGNLRYLKFYNSYCPQECETTNKINIPDVKLNLSFIKELRCLHWLNFPLEELPNNLNPTNLVDLKLPNSQIKQLWEDDKVTPCLKWVDLNHSSKLCSLSGLSKAEKLQRLNLEGCTTLKTLPGGMENMKMLSFLNLKGCTSLESLPEMNLISLKTLTLSGCKSFKEFPLVSENLRNLYIGGTAVSQFPTSMEKLQSLVVLNMTACKKLKEIPVRVGELKALQELILSDCKKLKKFPEIKRSSLHILLLDGTATEAMPLLPSLQYLCLSRNTKISCLPARISELSQLKWLDLKYCTSLTSVPEFPPNLQCLDMHGCSSVKTVSKPFARIMATEQNHSTFIFTNCKNLEQDAKEEITSYAQRKCHMLSYARKRYNGGLVLESFFSTCFPGCGVPSWFSHETVGSELVVKLLPHWHDKKLAGIALCAVVSFPDENQINHLSVTCTFTVKDEDNPWVPFTCSVGSWTKHGDKKDDIKSDHVFIGYTSFPHTIKCLEDGNSDKCIPSEASLKFIVSGGTSEDGNLKVLKCGIRLVYAKDINKNSSLEAKYDMPVGNSFQETSEGVNGIVKNYEEPSLLNIQNGLMEE